MKTIEELRQMDIKKLLAELTEVQKSLAESKFNVETGHSKDSHMIKQYKKQKAQIHVVISEKEVEAVKSALNAVETA